MNTKYRINPEKSSQSAVRTFELVFKIVSQDEIPPQIKIKNLFPEYILKPNIEKGRRNFTNSFFLPKSKDKWQSLYNMKFVEYGRNFFEGSEQIGTKSVAIKDRRYKKGYRRETHAKWGEAFKHHIFLPWSSLSDKTVNALKNEFDLIEQTALRNYKIGRLVVPIAIAILTVILGSQNGLIGLLGIIFFFYAISKYFVSRKKIEQNSNNLADQIERAFISQDEYLTERFLPYSQIEYSNLERMNYANEFV